MRIWSACLLSAGILSLSGCGVVSLAGSVASTAVDVTGAVVSTGVKVTGAVVAGGVNVVTGGGN